jgi:hypothetical protein
MRARPFLILSSAFLIHRTHPTRALRHLKFAIWHLALPRSAAVIRTLPVPGAHTWPPWPPRPTSRWRYAHAGFYRPTIRSLGPLGPLLVKRRECRLYKTNAFTQ